MAPIMLDIKDKVDPDLSVAIRRLGPFSKVFEGLVFMELGHFKGSGILPLGVAIALVKLKGMSVVTWDLISILVAWCCSVRTEFGLVGHAEELLLPSCNAFEPLPAIKIKQVILLGINGTSDRVISCND